MTRGEVERLEQHKITEHSARNPRRLNSGNGLLTPRLPLLTGIQLPVSAAGAIGCALL